MMRSLVTPKGSLTISCLSKRTPFIANSMIRCSTGTRRIDRVTASHVTMGFFLSRRRRCSGLFNSSIRLDEYLLAYTLLPRDLIALFGTSICLETSSFISHTLPLPSLCPDSSFRIDHACGLDCPMSAEFISRNPSHPRTREAILDVLLPQPPRIIQMVSSTYLKCLITESGRRNSESVKKISYLEILSFALSRPLNLYWPSTSPPPPSHYVRLINFSLRYRLKPSHRDEGTPSGVCFNIFGMVDFAAYRDYLRAEEDRDGLPVSTKRARKADDVDVDRGLPRMSEMEQVMTSLLDSQLLYDSVWIDSKSERDSSTNLHANFQNRLFIDFCKCGIEEGFDAGQYVLVVKIEKDGVSSIGGDIEKLRRSQSWSPPYPITTRGFSSTRTLSSASLSTSSLDHLPSGPSTSASVANTQTQSTDEETRKRKRTPDTHSKDM
jgi:hypothetical protein